MTTSLFWRLHCGLYFLLVQLELSSARCNETWITHPWAYIPGHLRLESASFLGECVDICVKDPECTGIDIDRSQYCWLTYGGDIVFANTLNDDNPGITHYELKRGQYSCTGSCNSPKSIGWVETRYGRVGGTLLTNVLTLEACQRRCFEDDTCRGFDWDTGGELKCWIARGINDIEEYSTTITHYQKECIKIGLAIIPPGSTPAWIRADHQLTFTAPGSHPTTPLTPVTGYSLPTHAPGCSNTWITQPWTYVPDGTRAPGSLSATDCAALCESQPDCTGIDIDGNEVCWLAYGGDIVYRYGWENPWITHYELKRGQYSCTDTCQSPMSIGWVETKYGHAAESIPASAASSLDDCQQLCFEDDECRGFDWDTDNEEKCRIAHNDSGLVEYSKTVTHYQKQCNNYGFNVIPPGYTAKWNRAHIQLIFTSPGPRTSPHRTGASVIPTRIYSTAQSAYTGCRNTWITHPWANVPDGIQAFGTPTECAAICEAQPDCTGFDIDRDEKCWLAYGGDIVLGNTAAFNADMVWITHYEIRRGQYSCTATCQSPMSIGWVETRYGHVSGSTPTDDTTLEDCQQRCFQDNECSGFDWDTDSLSKCSIAHNDNRIVEYSTTVTHYQKECTNGGIGIIPPGYTPEWSRAPYVLIFTSPGRRSKTSYPTQHETGQLTEHPTQFKTDTTTTRLGSFFTTRSASTETTPVRTRSTKMDPADEMLQTRSFDSYDLELHIIIGFCVVIGVIVVLNTIILCCFLMRTFSGHNRFDSSEKEKLKELANIGDASSNGDESVQVETGAPKYDSLFPSTA